MNTKKNPWYLLPALMAAVNLFWVALMFLPLRKESVQLSVRLNELRAKTKQEIPEPEIRRVQSKVDSLAVAVASVEQRLYPESELLKLGGVLETVGSRVGLKLVSVAPQYDSLTVVVNSKETINELPLRIEYEGTFVNLSRFLDQASEFPFILKMTGISIKKANPGNPELFIQLSGGVVIKKERGGQP
jgi:Tfp pilus assembly protein PilO